MKILLFTWNTHGTFNIPNLNVNGYDLIIISLQECYKIPLIDSSYSDFKHRKIESLYGLKTIILSKQKPNLRVKKVGLGSYGLLNKGFIAISINNTILHINAHLSAHEHNQNKRLNQLNKILGYTYKNNYQTILLTGDLNFRIVNGIDQANDLFNEYKNFKEAPIKFAPTYKYEKNVFSTKRTPSYCDRIIIASNHKLEFINYNSFHNINTSDHKPVYLNLHIGKKIDNIQLFDVKKIDLSLRERFSNIYQLIWENRFYAIFLILSLILIYKLFRQTKYFKNKL